MDIALPPRRAGLPPALLVALALAAAAGAWHARHIGAEADWDLRNYHLYDGFALLRGRLGRDIAPAQLQSFYAPLLDLLHALALAALNRQPALLGAVLALPQGLAGFLAFRLARALGLAPGPAAAAALIGVTGAAGASTFASAMSEMLPAAALLGALLLAEAETAGRAGLLAGAAVGMKLTAAPFAVGVFLLAPRRVRFGLGAAAGAAVTAGWWWAWLAWRYGDPVFPIYNQLFHSPWIAAIPFTDARFYPHGLWGALSRPLRWAIWALPLGSELKLRDPRLALGAIGLVALLGRRHRLAPRLAAIGVVGYALWATLFGIERYLVTLELLSGPLLLGGLAPAFARLDRRAATALACALAALVMAWTVVPDWGHAPPGPRAVAVRLPPLPPGSLVVMLDGAPMGYVAAFAPRDVRFVGAENNLLHPGAPGRLEAAVVHAIRAGGGPLWGLWSTRHRRGPVRAALAGYHLALAGACRRVRSNLDADALRICPLRRVGVSGGSGGG